MYKSVSYLFMICCLLLPAAVGAQSAASLSEKAGITLVVTYLQKTLRYPAAAIENGQFGNVIVSFTINANAQLADIHVLRQPSKSFGDEVTLRMQQYPGPLKIRPGKYLMAVTYQLNKNGELQSEALNPALYPYLLAQVQVTGWAPHYRTVIIADRWPQPAFSNDFKGNVWAATMIYHLASESGKPIKWTKRYRATDTLATARRPRTDTVHNGKTSFEIRRYDRHGLLTDDVYLSNDHVLDHQMHHYRMHGDTILEDSLLNGEGLINRKTYHYLPGGLKMEIWVYLPDNYIDRINSYTYNARHQLIEDRCTLYGPRQNGSLTITDRFEYDNDGRRVIEDYDAEFGVKSDRFTYQYTNFDRHGNWRKSVCMYKGKRKEWVKRHIKYSDIKLSEKAIIL